MTDEKIARLFYCCSHSICGFSNLSSCTVFLYFCILGLGSSGIMFLSTKSMSFRKMLSDSRSSTSGIHMDSLELIGADANCLWINFKKIDVSPSNFWFSCNLRASARKCLGCCYTAALYIFQTTGGRLRSLFNWDLGKTASLHTRGTSLSVAANFVKFLNFRNLHFVFVFSVLHDSKMLVLLRITFCFA